MPEPELPHTRTHMRTLYEIWEIEEREDQGLWDGTVWHVAGGSEVNVACGRKGHVLAL